jgi:PAS domain-containing protein
MSIVDPDLAAAYPTTILSIDRPIGAEPFSRHDMAQMRQLAPHLSRALTLRLGLLQQDEGIHAREQVLDALPHAVVSITSACQVTYANQAAEALLRREKVLALQ